VLALIDIIKNREKAIKQEYALIKRADNKLLALKKLILYKTKIAKQFKGNLISLIHQILSLIQ